MYMMYGKSNCALTRRIDLEGIKVKVNYFKPIYLSKESI